MDRTPIYKKNLLIIISSPSGAGKTSVCRRIVNNDKKVKLSVSHTTRPPRDNELNGVDYFFISHDTFNNKILDKDFLEYAKSQGNDLMTPAPHFSFPGLKPGDSWCVCARTWLAAVHAGSACPVDLEATHEEALKIIPFDLLETHAV